MYSVGCHKNVNMRIAKKQQTVVHKFIIEKGRFESGWMGAVECFGEGSNIYT